MIINKKQMKQNEMLSSCKQMNEIVNDLEELASENAEESKRTK